MLAPKDFLDALSGTPPPVQRRHPAAKSRNRKPVQDAAAKCFSKLDLVSREEFDSQMVVLARTAPAGKP
jgi:BMFP domain-containing protein YqiC